HSAHTPVGRAVGLTDAGRDGQTGSAIGRIRRRLADEGYGPTLARLARDVADAASPRDRRRLGQLVELAHEWDGLATLRATDFVRFVETRRIEDPVVAQV